MGKQKYTCSFDRLCGAVAGLGFQDLGFRVLRLWVRAAAFMTKMKSACVRHLSGQVVWLQG